MVVTCEHEALDEVDVLREEVVVLRKELRLVHEGLDTSLEGLRRFVLNNLATTEEFDRVCLELGDLSEIVSTDRGSNDF